MMHLKLDIEQMGEVAIVYLRECIMLELLFDRNEKVLKHYMFVLKEITPPGEHNEYKKNFYKEICRMDRGSLQSLHNEYTEGWF